MMANTMQRADFIRRLSTIKQWKNGDRRAPHKPLLLLYALGRVQQGEGRLVSIGDAFGPLSKLLTNFAPPARTLLPHYPFTFLVSDELWDIPGDMSRFLGVTGKPSKPRMLKLGVHGGLTDGDYRLLRADPELVQQAADLLLEAHFPSSLHDDIRGTVGLVRVESTIDENAVRDAVSPTRDPRFRPDVLRAYEYRCAVCDYDVRLGNDLFGLEAAHIKWKAAGGPDEIWNGLALCGFHHKAFDRGAWGLARVGEGYRILISSEVNGLSDAVRWLRDYQNKQSQAPQRKDWIPDAVFVRWHTEEVFRPPAA